MNKDAVQGTNTVELIEFAGSDLGHALSAWTSTGRDITEEKRRRVSGLITSLMGNEHHTPFEKSYLRFLIRVDNASHIHLLKHRIGVCINGESARYKEYVSPSYYIPPDWPEDIQKEYAAIFAAQFADYNSLLTRLEDYYATKERQKYARKRAKETARYVLPMSLQITLDVSFNWRSFIHFLVLRDSHHAQNEIRHISRRMLHEVEATGAFPYTVAAAKTYIAARQLLPDIFSIMGSDESIKFKSYINNLRR